MEDKVSKMTDAMRCFYCSFSSAMKNHVDEGRKDAVLDYVLRSRAWKDATIREKFNRNSTIICNKENIIGILKNELTTNTKEISRDFDSWHNSLCSKTDYGMRYGIWQKFINIAFKNLYCVKHLFPEFSNIWSKCHCPIDTQIAKKIYLTLRERGTVSEEDLFLSLRISQSSTEVNWNSINQEQYKKIQGQVKKICKEEKITPLEFDFLFWGNSATGRFCPNYNEQ